MRGLPISRRQILQAMAQFVSAAAGRNMTTAAYVAVTIGVAVMVLLTIAISGGPFQRDSAIN